MTSQLPALCFSCSHRTATADDLATPTILTCSAFPRGIPADIARGADHRTARGDEAHGLTYAQAAGGDAALDLRAWQAFAAA